VETYVAPSSDTVSAITEWLLAHGLKASPMSPTGDIVSVVVPVSQANMMFDANFSVFGHQASGKRATRTLAYSVPAALAKHIRFVHPTTACVADPTPNHLEMELIFYVF
jgi:tripeptidyl-peptidase I